MGVAFDLLEEMPPADAPRVAGADLERAGSSGSDADQVALRKRVRDAMRLFAVLPDLVPLSDADQLHFHQFVHNVVRLLPELRCHLPPRCGDGSC